MFFFRLFKHFMHKCTFHFDLLVALEHSRCKHENLAKRIRRPSPISVPNLNIFYHMVLWTVIDALDKRKRRRRKRKGRYTMGTYTALLQLSKYLQ